MQWCVVLAAASFLLASARGRSVEVQRGMSESATGSAAAAAATQYYVSSKLLMLRAVSLVAAAASAWPA